MKADYEVGIIGAGFAGLVAALRLKKHQKQSFVIFERAAEVGGTWRDNVYPGCACDVASPLYSFADEPNPNWSNLFSSQSEIFNYIKNVVDKNDLRKHIRFNTDIVNTSFLSENGCWQITDAAGNSTTAKVLIAGLGPLNRPNIPKFDGLEKFKGDIFHSAKWNVNADLTNKRVAVIGTGASAIQIVPNIASTVSHLSVFQRTAPWISHRYDTFFSESTKRRFEKFPLLMRLQREFHFWLNEFFGLGFVGSKLMNKGMTWVSFQKLKKEVDNPILRQKLTPNYTIGCKRILKSDDYYPTFNRTNVSLITENIKAFTENGILTTDGQVHELDVVIFATGFHVADLNFYTKFVGRSGENLIDAWKKSGGEAFKGTTISDYPNFAFMLGPNAGLGHNSVVHIMESQMNYIIQYIENIEKLDENGYLDLKVAVQDAYNQEIQKQFAGTVWDSSCKSWYLNEEGKNNTIYPRLNTRFRKITKTFDLNDYEVITKL